jgi:catechol 2,3-dioxygenase-like lactoylglutathione lyase family enzyme
VLKRIDHVMVCVPDLDAGIRAYTRIGFNVHFGGVHTGIGTHNAIAFNDEDYLELLAIRDAAEYQAKSPFREVAPCIERGGGLAYIVVQSDDLAADVAAMRSRGAELSDPAEGRRRTQGGAELRWKLAMPGATNPLPIFFVQHLTPVAERRAAHPGAGRHANRVTGIERAYIAVPDLARTTELYRRLLGVEPRTERGTVIHADMSVFDLGPSGLTLAQPRGPGAAADALARQGPGPFQVLLRTASMAAAERSIVEQGLPPPPRGVRHTGEQAMLVAPQYACGVSVGLVG